MVQLGPAQGRTKYNVTIEFKANVQKLLPSLSTEQHFENTSSCSDHIFSFLLSFITIHRIASLYSFSLTIIQVSTEITKIIHHMNCTKHAHCCTTVFSTWQLKRAFTHFMQNSPHVLQNRLLKFKKMSLSVCIFTLYKQFL